MADPSLAGREAVRQHHWSEALADFEEAASLGELTPDDLWLWADARWWSGQPDEAVDLMERAFAGFEREGRHVDAASIGARLAYTALRRLNASVGMGWIARVERLLEDQSESVAHGWLKILHTARALMFENDLANAVPLADQAIELGRRFASPGVEALALSFKGSALIHLGEWRQGIALMDEATAVATSEGTDPRAACDVYCNTIAVCHNLGDYRRAGEWTERAERWMQTNSLGGYTGICQVHRAELKRLRGSWTEAEQEARLACTELERFHILDGVGYANYEIGEVRRRMGDLAGAEQAFRRAYEYGHDAQPGISLLLMDQGDLHKAAASIDAAVERLRITASGSSSGDKLALARLLPAQVEIALLADDVATARSALTELQTLIEGYEGPSWEATALTCEGALLLHEGRPGEAVTALERARRIWQDIGLPYEGAQVRVLLGKARLALGDQGGADLEFRSAASTFSQLGASNELRRLRLVGGDAVVGVTTGGRERVTKVFMFTDIVTSTDLIGLIGDAAWENLLRWHDRALRLAISQHGGEEVRHTGDGFFVAFDEPRASLDCAVAIQRMLEQHRREHGFSPVVRIGLHLAEATKEGADYSGQGVHAAARVGALAEREEILVSDPLLQAVGTIPYTPSDGRQVSLKGITEPMTVHSIDWH